MVEQGETLIINTNGDVESFDLTALAICRERLKKPSFYVKNCQEKYGGDCSKCQMIACPIADQ